MQKLVLMKKYGFYFLWLLLIVFALAATPDDARAGERQAVEEGDIIEMPDAEEIRENQSSQSDEKAFADAERAAEHGDTQPGSGVATSPLKNKKTVIHPRDYDAIASDEYQNARTLCLLAEQCMRRGGVERAIKHLEAALIKDPKDPDVHELYATALERRMLNKSARTETVFSRCVLEWTRLYRGEIGEERGLTLKGMGLGAGMFSDDDRANTAKVHLLKLVGFLPHAWETNHKYVLRAVKQCGVQ